MKVNRSTIIYEDEVDSTVINDWELDFHNTYTNRNTETRVCALAYPINTKISSRHRERDNFAKSFYEFNVFYPHAM